MINCGPCNSENKEKNIVKPSILAPAGNKACFLAALAAGADAVYCGLKEFSARMEAKNFSIQELKKLTQLAHKKGTKVFVTLNSVLKQDEIKEAAKLLACLERDVKPDALIVQDLGIIELAKQVQFSGELHLSTLANLSFPQGLKHIRKSLGIDRVVIPRELDIDEIKAMASACPNGLSLEVFIHGALCYSVSGRCYWSSYLGGKSGLRGRCVQPCRRRYFQEKQDQRFFSCLDLSIDVLVKVLLNIPQISTWKIEGRKKNPHYVYYLVTAYKLLRDQGNEPHIKKQALDFLSLGLGREGTHFNFLPQRPQNPVKPDCQTGSGLFIGPIKSTKSQHVIIPRQQLFVNDVLRVGYEDDPWHKTIRIKRDIPKKGRFVVKFDVKKIPAKGTPAFLTDRREKSLSELISKLEKELEQESDCKIVSKPFYLKLSKRVRKKTQSFDLNIYRRLNRKKTQKNIGLWLSDNAVQALSKHDISKTWWCLGPVIWPKQEQKLKNLVDFVQKSGSVNFVLNAPWQTVFFRNRRTLNLWAGPFCNTSNILALKILESIGFSGAIISPELGRNDYFEIGKQSPLPLGFVISGNWPLSISRIYPKQLDITKPFTSPKGEGAWIKEYESDFWIYPNWSLDFSSKKHELERSGYSMFVNIIEDVPKSANLKKRPGLWNWNIGLK